MVDNFFMRSVGSDKGNQALHVIIVAVANGIKQIGQEALLRFQFLGFSLPGRFAATIFSAVFDTLRILCGAGRTWGLVIALILIKGS